MGVIHGAHRHEEILCPERLDDDLVAEHPGRCIDALVDHRTRTTLGLPRATPAATGRPADHPAERWTRDMDGALARRRARRRLEQEPHRHVAVPGLGKQLRPAHKPLAACRKNNLAPLRPGGREGTVWGTPRDRLAGARVALDGRPVKAVPAPERHFPQDQRTPRLQQSDPRVEAALKDLDGQENHEEAGTPGGAGAENVPAKREARQPRTRLDAGFQAP
jgi:transposase